MGRSGQGSQGVMNVSLGAGLKRAMPKEVHRAAIMVTPAVATGPIAKILLAAGGAPALEEFRSAIDDDNVMVLLATDGAEALARWWAEDPDLLVVDAALPTFDGFDVCRAIRGASETPVVIVASVYGDELVVRGLDCGADDVVTPPLRTAVFRLRLRAVINRYRAAKRDRTTKPPLSTEIPPALTLGQLTIDPESRTIGDDVARIPLTLREYRILELLALNPGLTLSFRRLYEYAWGVPGDSPIQRVTLRRYVMRIRKKLRPLGHGAVSIDSQRGLGYSIVRK